MVDTQLLERFVAGGDSTAFRDLVLRHGPAVLRVCRRVLPDPHEAEDAMQATFLILVQRAPSIRDPEQLDRWLAGVARRVAARARRRAAQRAEREHRWAEDHHEAGAEGERTLQVELRRLIRDEVGQLPEADRRPITLCYFEGLTHEEAARRLGCPVGTIKARLVRARRRLRDRLDRRGVAIGLGLLLLLLRRPAGATAAEAQADVTGQAMGWLSAGDLEAVRARLPHAVRLLDPGATTPAAGRFARPLLVAVLALVVVACGTTAMAARAAVARAEARAISARLSKVLDADCRVVP